MWKYTQQEELYHFGVPGMKWGRRKVKSSGNADVDQMYQKKAAYKQAKKEYNRSFNKAYNRSVAAWSPSKKHGQANDDRWDDTFDKADQLTKAKNEYRTSKRAVKNNAQAKSALTKYRAERIATFATKGAIAGATITVGAVAVQKIMDRKNGILHLGNGTTLYMYPNRR